MNWRQWFTPQSQETLTSQRETAIRLVLPLAVLINGAGLLGGNYLSSPAIFYTSGFFFILLAILSTAALVRGRITLSGVLLLLIFVRGDIATMLLSGYRDSNLHLWVVMNLILATVLLSSQYLDRYVVTVVLLYVTMMFIIHYSGQDFPSDENPLLFSAGKIVIYALLAWLMLRYLKSQLERYINTQQQRIASLETRLNERNQAEKSLRESEELYRTIVNTVPYSISIIRDGKYRFINPGGLQMLGYSGLSEIQDVPALETVVPKYRPAIIQRFNRLDGGKTNPSMDFEVLRADGTPIWLESRSTPITINGQAAAVLLAIDITERKRLEAEVQTYTNNLEKLVDERTNALRSAKEQLELILNTTSDALAFAQPNGDILMSNPAFLAMFDEQAKQHIEAILSLMADSKNTELICDALLRVIYNSERQQLEAQIISRTGQETDVDLTFIPVHNVDGDSRSGILLSGHDITHLKEIERFKSRFVADAVHDLATPITGLSTRLYLLQRSPEKLAHHVQSLENQIQHLRNLLEDLRTLSQADHGQMVLNLERCDVEALLRRVFDTYEPVALDKNQSLRLSIVPNLPQLRLDQQQIERVLVNLVSNAIDYTFPGKTISIEAVVDDETVVFRIIDQGMGITAQELPLIFDRFYRTAKARESKSTGTGLGLAITKQIVELHGGSVTVTSEPGQGSIFTVRLPLRM